jgi:hypothetical protein
MTVNRKLEISVTFSVTDAEGGGFGGTAVYAQTGSTPDMGQIVDADGTIHLDRASAYDSSQYNQNVDLVFTLASPTSGAHSFDVAWATKYGAGMTIEVPEGGSSSEMAVLTNEAYPNRIIVEDKDDDSNIYNYKPAIELIRPGHDRYYISLEPQIVNRPRNR